MSRWILLATAGLMLALALGVARRILRDRILSLFERLMEDAMPGMMDACFARMPRERREFMLAHCRGALDRVAAKYVASEPPEDEDTAPDYAEAVLSARV